MSILKPFLPCDYLEKPLPLKIYYSICAMYKEFCFQKRAKSMTLEQHKYLLNIVSFPPNNEFYYSTTLDELKNNVQNGVLHVNMDYYDKDSLSILVGEYVEKLPLTLVLHFSTVEGDEILTLRNICTMNIVRNPQSKCGWSIY